ncbi:DUF7525 family protein [Halarchaeum nitratireducens]|uniref:Uncharacterized protein n=1 Tax=Halarchaeum nitratireducens TaxID=489913 RepID=A0A830GC72_9EURY|nr:MULTISPECIES: hypothetical protein [Halarchaeum]MBP2250868.1 Mg/Co/Ni transporter MgtE [Halarchaeum solikamskense]GGN19504.1 hypothetical protein GCM10009021_20770 [Halarchaeum nitratireducens]
MTETTTDEGIGVGLVCGAIATLGALGVLTGVAVSTGFAVAVAFAALSVAAFHAFA